MFQIGICNENLNNFDKAFDVYFKLNEDYDKSSFLDRITYDLGRMYAKKGDKVKARECFEKVKVSFPDSLYLTLSLQRIALLDAEK